MRVNELVHPNTTDFKSHANKNLRGFIIFQCPTGTGLGLSLAFDIIKAHGGNIRVLTKEGEGSEFMIHLPSF